MTCEISIYNNNFILHCSGAIFWKDRSLLLISDVHLGKISHFRKHGLALPVASFSGNFKRLTEVCDHFQPEIVCFLGDLFHSDLNYEWKLFGEWINTRHEKLLLIAGNHDILSPDKYENLGLQTAAELRVANFLFTHYPMQREGCFNFCGHIHPGVRLHGLGRQLLQLPCFYKTDDQLILPAFGEFTGKWIVTPQENAHIYAITKHTVIPIKLRPGRRNFS